MAADVGAGEQARERAVAGGPLPEHAQQERREQGGVHKAKDELQRHP